MGWEDLKALAGDQGGSLAARLAVAQMGYDREFEPNEYARVYAQWLTRVELVSLKAAYEHLLATMAADRADDREMIGRVLETLNALLSGVTEEVLK